MQECYGGKDQVQVANGAGLSISHVGQSALSGSSRPLYLRNVLHVPRASQNLLSVQKLTSDNDAFAELHPDLFYLKDRATRVVLRGRCRGGLYLVPSSKSLSSIFGRRALFSAKLSLDVWHRRLGHPSKSVVESVLRSNKFSCAPFIESSVCDACQRAKVQQLPFRDSTHAPLELVHSDVWGPAVT